MQRLLRTLGAIFVASAALNAIGFAQEVDDLNQVRVWLEQGVNSAFLTQEQADIMLRSLQERRIAVVSRAVATDVAQPGSFSAPFDNPALEEIVQQFTSGIITAEQANEQAAALGLVPDGASLLFSTDSPSASNSPAEVRSFSLVRETDGEEFQNTEIKVIATRIEEVKSD